MRIRLVLLFVWACVYCLLGFDEFVFGLLVLSVILGLLMLIGFRVVGVGLVRLLFEVACDLGLLFCLLCLIVFWGLMLLIWLTLPWCVLLLYLFGFMFGFDGWFGVECLVTLGFSLVLSLWFAGFDLLDSLLLFK